MKRKNLFFLFMILFMIIANNKIYAYDQLLMEEVEGDIVSFSSSYTSSGLVTESGQVYVWGQGGNGELGTGKWTPFTSPYRLNIPNLDTGDKAISIEFGRSSIFVLTQNGVVYSSGYNEYGEIGSGNASYTNQTQRRSFSSVLPTGDKIIKVVSSGLTTFLLTEKGNVITFGENSSGQIGNGSTAKRVTAPFLVPTRALLNENEKIVNLSSSQGFVVAVTNEGRILYWGIDQRGFFKDDNSILSVREFDVSNYMTSGEKIIDVKLTAYTIMLLSDSHNLYSWGGMNTAQLGYEIEGWYSDTPTKIDFDSILDQDEYVVSVISSSHTMVLTNKNRVFYWGLNFSGQLMDSADTFLPTLLPIEDYIDNGDHIKTVYTGSNITAIVTNNNDFYVFGSNDIGKLGVGLTESEMPATSTPQLLYGNKRTIRFESNSSEIISDLQGYPGDIVELPIPTKEGYQFKGWYIDQDLTKVYNSDLVFTKSMTLYAKFELPAYNISFDSNGGTNIEMITVEPNELITLPQDPTKTGYTFEGWYTDSTLTTMFNPETPITGDLSLFAKWTINTYTVTFDSEVTPVSVQHNELITLPEDPTKTGYTFEGWYTDSTLATMFNPETPITRDLSLFAKWTINTYTVTFDSEVTPVSVQHNELITLPEAPTKTGYTFEGWYTDGTLTTPFNPETPITGDLSLFAKWTINTYTISFNTNGGTNIESITLAPNQQIIAPLDPTKEGYIFNGWSIEVPSVMPNQNLILVAKWLAIKTESDIAVVDGIDEAINLEGYENQNIDINVIVESKENKDVSETEKEKVANYATNQLSFAKSEIYYLDIKVIIENLDTGEKTNLTQTDDNLKFSVIIPEEHRGNYQYKVVRVHNGVVETLASNYNSETNEIRFESDKFSTYAIVYDTPISATNDSNTNSLLFIILSALLIIVIIIFILFLIFKNKKTNENNEEITPITENDDDFIMVAGKHRHEMSFKAKLSLSSTNIREKYAEIKSMIYQLEPANTQYSFKHESLIYKKKSVLRLRIRGRVLHMYVKLPFNLVSKLNVRNVSDIKAYEDTPILLTISEKDTLTEAYQLLEILASYYDLYKVNRKIDALAEHPVLTQKKLIDMGLIRKKKLVGKYYLD